MGLARDGRGWMARVRLVVGVQYIIRGGLCRSVVPRNFASSSQFPTVCGSPMLLALGAPLLLLLALVLWLLLALASQLYRVRRHLCLSPPATAAPD